MVMRYAQPTLFQNNYCYSKKESIKFIGTIPELFQYNPCYSKTNDRDGNKKVVAVFQYNHY